MPLANADTNFTNGHRDSAIEDGKFRNRSKNWETLGYPRMKG